MPAWACSGVALETASTAPPIPAIQLPPCGATQAVISVAQEASKIARAASAGFMKFCPMPPKNCLTRMIAMAEPIAASHHGADAGRL